MEFLVRLLKLVIPHVTPEIREALKEALESLAKRAEKTPNPWDDLCIAIVKEIFFPGE